jgi:hypothetical protein
MYLENRGDGGEEDSLQSPVNTKALLAAVPSWTEEKKGEVILEGTPSPSSPSTCVFTFDILPCQMQGRDLSYEIEGSRWISCHLYP